MGADRRNSELVAKRLIESFSSLYEDDTYDISFVVKPINWNEIFFLIIIRVY